MKSSQNTDGTVARLVIGALISSTVLGVHEPWIKFLAGTGAIVLTFLAGAELDPVVFKLKWKEATALGIAGFVAPFLGCAAVAYFWLGWDRQASWLAGVALSTTSVAVVYAVMLETGLNQTTFGKTVLAGCFINDLGTVLALGLIFAPFTVRTLVFVGGSLAAFAVLPWLTPRFFRKYGNRPSELETKFLLLCLFGLSHGIIDTAQYSFLIAAVVASAVVPTLIANAFFLPRHLLGRTAPETPSGPAPETGPVAVEKGA